MQFLSYINITYVLSALALSQTSAIENFFCTRLIMRRQITTSEFACLIIGTRNLGCIFFNGGMPKELNDRVKLPTTAEIYASTNIIIVSVSECGLASSSQSQGKATITAKMDSPTTIIWGTNNTYVGVVVLEPRLTLVYPAWPRFSNNYYVSFPCQLI